MRILLINEFPPPFGGAEYHVSLLTELLEKKGHEIYSFFPAEHGRGKQAGRAAEALKRLLNSKRFEIAHIHGLGNKYYSVYSLLYREKIPIVQTLHEYSLLCPSGNFFRKGAVCQKCLGGKLYYGGLLGCTSIFRSAGEYIGHSLLRRGPLNRVAACIATCRHFAQTFRKGGYGGPLTVLYNFLELEKYDCARCVKPQENLLVYFGRLSPGKGILNLMEAVRETPFRLRIIGDGELREIIADRIRNGGPERKIEMTGFLEGEALYRSIAEAQMSVTAPQWLESASFNITEAFALGRPAAGPALGGLGELISEERGVLFKDGGPGAIREALKEVLADKNRLSRMGKAARRFAEENFSPESYYQKLMEVYSRTVAKAEKKAED